MHYPKEDDGERYTACPIIKGLRGIEPLILYPKEESGSHCLLILDLKPRSAGLIMGSIVDIAFKWKDAHSRLENSFISIADYHTVVFTSLYH